MEDWLQASFVVPPAAAEAASGALFESGAGGVWEDRPDDQGRVVLRGGFPQGSEMRLMAELPAALLAISEALSLDPDDFCLLLELRPGEDYAESWKRDLAPIEISPRLTISPSWWQDPLPGGPDAAVLRLDPGSAFGSGHHPTTFLCLKVLCDLAERGTSPASVLDLGAGSGVLALSAALLFPNASIEAIDNDPDTIFCAAENASLNSLSGRVAPREAVLSDLEGEFELILANLTRNALIDLSKEIAQKSKAPGRVVLSGLLSDQAADVLKAMAAHGFICEAHLGRAEWSALSLVRGLPCREAPERLMVEEGQGEGQGDSQAGAPEGAQGDSQEEPQEEPLEDPLSEGPEDGGGGAP